jgi:hypothetical protein
VSKLPETAGQLSEVRCMPIFTQRLHPLSVPRAYSPYKLLKPHIQRTFGSSNIAMPTGHFKNKYFYMLYKFLCFQGHYCCGRLGSYTVKFCGWVPTFRGKILPPSLELKCVGSGIGLIVWIGKLQAGW